MKQLEITNTDAGGARQETRYVGDVPISCVWYGAEKAGEPVVLLNGISLPPDNWGLFPHLLNRPVVAIGLPGAEHTPRGASLGFYAQVVKGAIEQVMVERTSGDTARRNYSLLGFSFGGLLAQRIALEGNVDKLALVSTMPFTPYAFMAWPDPRAAHIVSSSNRTIEDIAYLYGGTVEQLAELGVEREIDPGHHERQVWAALFSGHLVLPTMWQHRRPETLVVMGDEDRLMPPTAVRLGARMLGAQLVVRPGEGHGLLRMNPEPVATAVNEFMAS